MDSQSALVFFEKSKIFTLVHPEISDITYNGTQLYVETIYGLKSEAPLLFSQQEAYEFIKHLSDICGKNFNYASPILDIAFSDYRLNAIHSSIAYTKGKGVVNFSIRVSSKLNRVPENDHRYAPKSVMQLLNQIIRCEQSLLIGGVTGSGKTELQRYLIQRIPNSKRIILIQDSAESMPILQKNISIWLYPTGDVDRLKSLFQAGLRSHPDWMMLSEIRGAEAQSMFHALASGMAMITTIHCRQVMDMKYRLFHLLGITNSTEMVQIKKELASYIQFYVMLEKQEIHQQIHRRIQSLMLMYLYEGVVYEKEIFKRNNGEIIVDRLPAFIAQKIKMKEEWYCEEASG